MALIVCPECKNQISDRAEKCPHCGLPSKYFSAHDADAAAATQDHKELEYRDLGNILLSFDKDYCGFFALSHYITHREETYINDMYRQYYKTLCNKMIFQYVCNNARTFRVDIDSLKSFLTKMHTLSADIVVHNTNYVDRILAEEKDYFDHILEDIDPVIKLDEEQRRAVITDDDHCMLVAGAGAGKTTTMAAKVKYLVEKQGVQPDEIIVISYTRKAIGELQDRINKGLKIPAQICTFHKFAFDIVKKFSVEPPEMYFMAVPIIIIVSVSVPI